MKIEDYIKKVNSEQFILKEISIENGREFAVTECTLNDEFKHICIEFNEGKERFIPLDYLLLVFIEFYGKEYLNELISKLTSYESIKDKSLN